MSFPPDVDLPLELVYLAQAACRMPEDCQIPVSRGNGITLVWINRRQINASRIGTKIATTDGGYLERITLEGWVQWRFVAAPPADPQPQRQGLRKRLSAWRRGRFASSGN